MPAVVSRRVRPRIRTAGARHNFIAFVIGGILLAGCSSNDAQTNAEPADAQPVDNVPEFAGDCASLKSVPTFREARAGVFSHCVGCHSSSLSGDARQMAPATINFDTYESAKNSLVLARPVQIVKGRYMPPPRGEGITNTDRNQLYEWARCGSPP
ncbi:MAG TPA: hypothetical protein VF395_16445 [Polyangiaceae bacterium]